MKAQMRIYISNEAMVLKGKVGISVTGHIIRIINICILHNKVMK